MNTHINYLLFFLCIIVISCKDFNKQNDKIFFSAKFIKSEKKIELTLKNKTQEDFIVLIPKIIGFKISNPNYEKKIENNIIKASLMNNLDNSKYHAEMETIYKKIRDKNDFYDNFPTAILINKNDNLLLEYRVKGKLISNQIYKSKTFKMRDVLNVPYNVEIVENILNYRKSDGLKIYLDDFVIEDSLIIRY